MSRVRRLAGLLLLRPTTSLEAVAYSGAMFVLVMVVGLVAGRPLTHWLLFAVGISLVILLTGLLQMAGRSDRDVS